MNTKQALTVFYDLLIEMGYTSSEASALTREDALTLLEILQLLINKKLTSWQDSDHDVAVEADDPELKDSL